MDPIDQRARAARTALDDAVADVAPQPFQPRSRRVAPALLGAGIILGGAFGANAVLNGGAADQVVATDSTSSTTEAATAATTSTTAPARAVGTAVSDADERVEHFVFDQPPVSLGDPVTFELPDEFDVGPSSFTVEVYGSGTDLDPFVDGDIGIMRATFMDVEDLDGEPLTIAGREVMVDTTSEPGTIINWAEGNTMIGVASWTLDAEDLIPTAELFLADPTARPDGLPNGFRLVSATDDFLGGFAFGGGSGRVMYVPDKSNPLATAVSVGVVDGASSASAASWLISGVLADQQELDDGLILSRVTPADPDELGSEEQVTIFVPGMASDGRMVAVSAVGADFSDDELIAAARTLRPATPAEVEAMADAGSSLYDGDIGDGVEIPPLLDGTLADGRELMVVSSGIEMCVKFGDDPTSDGECFTPSTDFDFDPESEEQPAFFWSGSESDQNNLMLMGFTTGPSGSSPDDVLLEFADGTTAPLERVPGQMQAGRFGQFESVPVALVEVNAAGEQVDRSPIPPLELAPGQTVTVMVLG